MNAVPVQSRSALAGDLPAGLADEQLSALIDGEIQATELDAVLFALAEDPQHETTCQRYQLIGDLLRGKETIAGTSPQAFVSGVRARLQVEPLQPPRSVVQPHPALPAANDAVFRWKLVAGAASVAAVVAVSWSLLGVAPGSNPVVPGPQLVQATPGAQPVVAGQPSAVVVVNTAQGPVIRDARLEELLAEHRQYGGMSALQMPAGFLRDATHQSAPQR